MSSKFIVRVIILVCMALTVASCYGCTFGAPVGENEVGLDLDDGVQVSQVLSPGRHKNMSLLAKLQIVNVGVLTRNWEDPDLATKDKQLIGLALAVSFKRKSDSESIIAAFRQYRNESLSDEALSGLVLSRVSEAAKSATVKYTIDELLGVTGGGRGDLSNEIQDLISPELSEFYVDIVDVSVTNISTSESYQAVLERKTQVQGEKELSEQEAARLETDLLKEQTQTKIEVEKANREAQVAEAKAEILAESPETMEIRRLELLADIIGPNDKIIFVPVGGDISLLFSSDDISPEVLQFSDP